MLKEPDGEVSVPCKGISGFFLVVLSLGRKQLNELWEEDTEKTATMAFTGHTHTQQVIKTAEPSQLQLPVPPLDPQTHKVPRITLSRSAQPPEIWIESQDWKVSDPLKFTQSGRIRTRSSCVLSLNIKCPFYLM